MAETTDDRSGHADPEGRTSAGHRGAVVVGAVVLGLVGVLLVGYGLLALRLNWFPFHSASPREVSLDDARRRFLEERVGDGGSRPFTPPEGVYRYEGTGSESLSNPPRTQPEGPRVPGTVTWRPDGCWDFRLDYSTNHWRLWSFCASADALVQVGSRVSQRWDFGTFAVENLTTMTCAPPGVILEATMVVGDEWTSECRGENTQISGTTISTGTHRLVATETLRIAGTEVEANHFRDDRVVSGAQSGTEQFDFWLRGDGLLLKGTQRISVDSDSPLGKVTYTQESAFSLVSALP
jgi:hypothetical protein